MIEQRSGSVYCWHLKGKHITALAPVSETYTQKTQELFIFFQYSTAVKKMQKNKKKQTSK